MQDLTPAKIPLSVLDLAPVPQGSTGQEAIHHSVELAQLAETIGYTRYWFAEHHSLHAIASSAPEVLIAHIAAATQHIRIGSGGIMLPNHAPLRVVEIFRTLEALHPGRIDLGVGRAPGANRQTPRALRSAGIGEFSGLMSELMTFARSGFPRGHPYDGVFAMPDDVPCPPIWILGSSGASASSAAQAGMGYSFATHFTIESPVPALRTYRAQFKPSQQFPKPHSMLAVEVVCAEDAQQAEYLATTCDLTRLRVEREEFPALPSPEEALAYPYSAEERERIKAIRKLLVVGNPATVRERVENIVEESKADEVMLVCNIHNHEQRLNCYRLLAEAFELDGETPVCDSSTGICK